jgi:DNA-binding CsgD family transcriptional regulator
MPKPTADPGYSSALAHRKARRTTPAIPPEHRQKPPQSHADGRAKTAPAPPRHHTDQERIDRATELKQQGLSNKRIAAILGCGEKTIRGIVKDVKPELHLPHANLKPGRDPRVLREQLLAQFVGILHRDPNLRQWTVVWQDIDNGAGRVPEYGGPPSILFLNEAEKLLRAKLSALGIHALGFLASDWRSKAQFLREVIGHLYWDYIWWHKLKQEFGSGDYETGDWRPPSERPRIQDDDCDDPHGLDT